MTAAKMEAQISGRRGKERTSNLVGNKNPKIREG